MPTVTTPGLDMSGLAELDAATDHTQAVLDDPEVGAFDRLWAAEQEAELYDQFPAEPQGHAELEAHEAELEEPEAG